MTVRNDERRDWRKGRRGRAGDNDWAMRTLDYVGLDTTRVKEQVEKVRAAIERDDFRSADVKKLAQSNQGPLYRAKLDRSNRLLLTFVRSGAETCALLLEVIEQHAYEKSRFLRGVPIDEAKIADEACGPAAIVAQASAVRYLHPHRREIHLLDKVLSFDDAQEAVWRVPPPLILVGAAGSGKTALVLEKIKPTDGDVLYVTQSSYLAENARGLYYANGFERDEQDVNFLSYREFLESLRVPEGREAQWSDFSSWFARNRIAFRELDAHQTFEEIRGVIAADAQGVLTRDGYRGLGVRQSIFLDRQRDALYDLFERYRAWLKEQGLFDVGLLTHDWRPLAQPRYDFVVVDEAQDMTAAQLALILATLRHPDRFVLCGDSNQIVHPNLFSWSRVKSLLWRGEQAAQRHELFVLRANFRNGREATRVANALLKAKQARFGSIDRESNFLVESVASDEGEVAILPDTDAVLRQLDANIRRSARYAVLVLREEDKEAARAAFRTPLLFSVREAKGLEYDNIVLFRFIAGQRARFAEIADGVTATDLERGELDYKRGRDKSDKSLEIYKFFVNALYVALTRGIRNVYLIEPDPDHPLLRLLQVRRAGDSPVRADVSSIEQWQREARRLELQGKQEQADSIRTGILHQASVPWTVSDEAWLRATLVKVFRERTPGGKPRQQLLEHAACHDLPELARHLDEIVQFGTVRRFDLQQHGALRKHLAAYAGRNFKDVLRQCEQYGVDHRTPMNLTPLMAAAAAGNVALVDALLERGADPHVTDHFGRATVHWTLGTAFREGDFAQGPLSAIYERVAPSAIDVEADGRLVRIDRHLSEYFLWQTLWTLYGRVLTHGASRGEFAFDTAALLDAWKNLPAIMLRPERGRRAYLSGLLARNEIDRDYAYNRKLFKRVGHGFYLLNMKLAVRAAGTDSRWTPVAEALNLRLLKEVAVVHAWGAIDEALREGGAEPPPVPIAAERALERERRQNEAIAKMKAQDAAVDARSEDNERRKPADPDPGPAGRAAVAPPAAPEAVDLADEPPAPWGTPRAKAQALARLRRQIEEQRRKGEADSGETN